MIKKNNITIDTVLIAGPFGDCTCNYEIITNATTLEEFIPAILGEDRHQTFCLHDKTGELAEVCLAFAYNGVVERKASCYESLLPKKIKNISANGGWGQMTYDIWVEGELPKQDREEFVIVYWGHTFKKEN